MPSASGVSRRRFLATAAATAAVPYFIPGSALGKEGKAAPSERITVGMIGVGRQALIRNFGVFMAAPDAQIVALCDVDRWRLGIAPNDPFVQLAARRQKVDFSTLKDCYRTTDYRDLLARKDIDAVMISTPDHWHVRQALDAVAAGKDICCEKPLGLCIHHTRKLADAVAKSPIVFRTDSEFRSVPVMFDAVKLVRTGKIGNVKKIGICVPIINKANPMEPTMPVPEEFDYETWLGPAPEAPYTEKRCHPRRDFGRPGWFANRDYCHGMVTNWGYHPSDVAQWGNDSEHTSPVEIEGTGKFPPKDGIWNTMLDFDIRYRYANGAELTFHGLWDLSQYQSFVRFEGDEGWVCAYFGPDHLEASSEAIKNATVKPEEFPFACENEKRDFLNCVKTRRRTLEDAEVGHRSGAIGLLGYASCLLGRKLHYDPVAEKFVNDDEANKLLDWPTRAPWTI